MNEENIEKESRLPPEKLEAIRTLAAAGYNNMEIASALSISRKTAGRYRPDNEELDDNRGEAREEGEEEREVPEVDTENSAAIFEIFDEGGDPVTAIRQGFTVQTVNYLWDVFLAHKGMEHPREIANRMDKVAAVNEIQGKRINFLDNALSDLMMNIEWIVENSLLSDDRRKKNIVYCPHCNKLTYLVKNRNGLFICHRCQKRPFQVYDDE